MTITEISAESALVLAKQARSAAWTARIWGEASAESDALKAAEEWERIAKGLNQEEEP